MMRSRWIARRSFLWGAAAAGGSLVAASLRPRAALAQAAAIITPDGARPHIPYGVQTGDLTGDRCIVWSRTDRPARMIVDWATREDFADARRIVGPAALEDADYTAWIDLTHLP